MAYTIEFRPSVLKSLEKIPKRDLVRIKRKVEELGTNLPDPNTTRMRGSNSFHRGRTGAYHIVYEIHNDKLVIVVVKIGHRKDVYRNLP